MKSIKFLELEIQNFKRIENLKIAFDDKTSIYGRNGAGKTTIADAIMFVLFNKDLEGNAPVKAGFKRVDELGREIPNLTMNVKLKLLVDGTVLILERKQTEKWTTKRGSSEAVFAGNEQVLSVNESTVKTSEYDNAVNDIVNEELFRLLTNPHFFMNNIDQKKRREMLLSFIGDKDAEIENNLKLKTEFAPLVEEWDTDLNRTKSFAIFVDWLQKKAKTDNDELKAIPERIQALQKAIGEPIDENKVKLLIAGYNAEIDKIDEQLNKPIEVPAWLEEYETKAYQLKNQASQDKKQAYDKLVAETNEKIKDRSNAEQNVYKLEVEFNSLYSKELNHITDIDFRTKERQRFLHEWEKVSSEVFVKPELEEVCSHCGQPLPSDQIEDHIKHAEEAFNATKKQKLENIAIRGKEAKNALDLAQSMLEAVRSEISIKKLELEKAKEVLNSIPKVEIPSLSDTDASIKLNAEADELLNKVKEYRTANAGSRDNSELINQKASYRMMIDDANRKLGQIDQQEVIKKQIAELEAREEKLQGLKVHYEVLINLSDDFLKAKNEMFEAELSKHFDSIKWQLFEPQINGGYKQVCEPLFNGRNWTQQSVGEQIFTGIDIIKAFQNQKQTEAPVIIDNRESLTLPLDINSQIISMYVNDTYDTLVVS